MRSVGSRNTGPEILVRRAAHSLGLRFRLHRKSLPGTPDIVFPKSKTAIFVHGCFWHRHSKCRKATTPRSSVEFWNAKFDRNVARDAESQSLLRKLGWKVIVVWQCEVPTKEAAEKILKRIFSSRQGRRHSRSFRWQVSL